MDDLFSRIECRSKLDSIVMRILRSAMDKAHENLQSKDGPIEFLHQRSTFYELASILVEGGLGIVQEEEMDILEGGHDKILSDLMEIRHWLHGRMQDMKHLIVDKDRELKERFENESKLRQALELKERELHEMLEPGIKKSEGPPDSLISDQVIHTEGDISKLKSSVDQQVWNIKQKLEDEEKILSHETRKMISPVSSPDLSFDSLYKQINQSSGRAQNELFDQNVLIKRMSSDIDILKETLDQAFGKMQIAEVLPLEKQWRCNIEKQIETILVKGFIRDLQQSFGVEWIHKAGISKDNWFDFIDEMRSLCHELKTFCSTSDEHEKQGIDRGNSTPPRSICRTSSEPLPEIDCMEKEEGMDTDGSNFVAKMVKNHESIIRKQRRQWDFLTREFLQREGRSPLIKRDEDSNRLERRIQDAITRLDNLIKRNHRFGETTVLSDSSKFQKKRKIPRSDTKIIKGLSVESLGKENGKLKEERDGLFLQMSVIEDTYQLLFQCIAKDVNERLEFQNTVSMIKNGDCDESSLIHGQKKDRCEGGVGRTEDPISAEILQQYVQNSIREDVYVVFLQETIKEWKRTFEDKGLPEDSSNFVPKNPAKSSDQSPRVTVKEISSDDFLCDSNFPETIGSLLKENIYMEFFKEIAETMKSEREAFAFENVVREEIYQFVVLEAVKESHASFRESEAGLNQLDFRDVTPRSRKLTKIDSFGEVTPRSRTDGGEESLIHELDSLLRSLEAEEDLMLKASSEIMEHSVNNSLVILNCEEMDERHAIEWLLTDDESTFSSVSEKLERALQQLHMSKELLVEMEQSLEVSMDLDENDLEMQLHYIPSIKHERIRSIGAPELDLSSIDLTPFTQFQRLMVDFEQKVRENLDDKFSRLGELKLDVKALFEPLALVRTRKLLYKKAFISRCHNLKFAESEVDLLGDQVEALLHLLERIYVELNQNSSILSQYFGVSEILKLIRAELENAASFVKS